MSRRDEMLREMGLTPVWRLREPAAPAPASDPMAATEPQATSDAQREPASSLAEATAVAPVAMEAQGRRAAIMRMDWAELKTHVAACRACRLHQKRTRDVFGVGDERAEWLFVGEGPGAEEDLQGEPFVGQAGKLLDNMLAALKLRRGENVYIANVVKCLRYNALVQLGNGAWERIGRLVAQRYADTVMSLDESGALVPKRVVGWHATPLAGRRVYRLSYRSAKRVGASTCGIQLTGDHPVLTEKGWTAVQDLRPGDRIATGQGLSVLAFDVVCGTLLGDGHISARNAHLSMAHSSRQSEYARWKAHLLAELRPEVSELAVSARVGGDRVHPTTRVRTRASRALRTLRSEFYGDRKRVPEWLAASLNPRMLAFWFMDDGYTRIREGRQPLAEIATCAFSDGDLQILLRGLARLRLVGKASRGRIYFDVSATRTLCELIAPYVPAAMRYKLHPEVARRVPFDEAMFERGAARVLYDEVEASELVHEGSDQTFFCLDVEHTHNFVTAGGVVHNCRPPGNRNPQADEAQACEPYLKRQIELIRPRLIVALGKIAAVNLLGRDASIASLRGKVHDYMGIPLIVTYHPAYLLRTLPDKAKAWADLCFAQETMRGLQTAPRAPT